jgi:excisionase family DNA binding protein
MGARPLNSTPALPPILPEYLSPPQAAAYLSLSPRILERWRAQGVDLPFMRLGRRVRYRRADLDAWMESKRVAPEVQS